MNPLAQGDNKDKDKVYKDAIFISPHKFPGGPGTPGILAVKKSLIDKASCPSIPGGGTVFWVCYPLLYASNIIGYR